MSNHLKTQTSPYLLQHAENPVDWYPWCEEAFEKAEKENKPIFLSIGYSTCHWCHVMAHESFENEEIAGILNQSFISIKVDREERPDIDSVYMSVCQALTGSGGWPMSIFMTPEQKPFFAGTYFPPDTEYGMTGFKELLLAIADKWKSEKTKLSESAEHIIDQISTTHTGENAYSKRADSSEDAGEGIDSNIPARAVEMFAGSFDEECGGFGQAPKFPMAHNLIFLMLYSYLKREDTVQKKQDMMLKQVTVTLEKMRRGGIFDHIGHGFSRYATDRFYLVPHFEKMLYDNALLIIAYAAAYRLTGDAVFLDTAEQTAEYIFREMTGEGGGFYSAQDADSEGEEGKYYLWSYKEVCEVLGEERGRQLCEYFSITGQGNFEGKNIPNLLSGGEIRDTFAKEKEMLYEYRKSRYSLHLDDKILTAWNALMICALSVLYRISGKARYLTAAECAQRFIEENLAEGSTLYVSFRSGVRSEKGFLDEYAYYAASLIQLYEATADERYLKRAEEICREAVSQFADENGGYFLSGRQNGELIFRPKETYDGALPSGNAMMAYVLVRLSEWNQEYREAAKAQLAFLSAHSADYPAGHSMFCIAMLYYCYPPMKITVVLSEDESAGQVIRKLPLLADIVILPQETEAYKLLQGKTTYYVCKDHTCLPPTNQAPFFRKDIS